METAFHSEMLIIWKKLNIRYIYTVVIVMVVLMNYHRVYGTKRFDCLQTSNGANRTANYIIFDDLSSPLPSSLKYRKNALLLW
jgi:hypothetical protein